MRKRFFWSVGLYGVVDALMVDILLKRGDASWAFATLRVSLIAVPLIFLIWALWAYGYQSLHALGRKAALSAALVVLGFFNIMAMRAFVYDIVVISGDSHGMWPTLKPEESYYVSRLSPLRVGDIAVFRWEVEGEDYQVVKRVVAFKGDEVSYTTSRLKLGGIELEQRPCPGVEEHEEGLYRQETLGAKQFCVTMDLADAEEEDWSEPRTVTEDFFIVGDNRNDSIDSRWSRWDYPFTRSSLVGVVVP